MKTIQSLAAALVGLALFAGCGHKHKAQDHDDDDHGHVHERGQLKIADAGKYHACLTAHRSKQGNELDISFETQDEKDPQPVALALESFKAEAMTADGQRHELEFAPAPADERPKGEKPGTCSKFSAKAPWMKNTDKLEVVAKIKIEGKDVTLRWRDFDPMKYGHDAD
jgi:hypothetical protein